MQQDADGADGDEAQREQDEVGCDDRADGGERLLVGDRPKLASGAARTSPSRPLVGSVVLPVGAALADGDDEAPGLADGLAEGPADADADGATDADGAADADGAGVAGASGTRPSTSGIRMAKYPSPVIATVASSMPSPSSTAATWSAVTARSSKRMVRCVPPV